MKLIIIIFIIIINFIYVPVEAVDFKIIDPNQLNKYPLTSTSSQCNFLFNVWISDADGIDLTSISLGGARSATRSYGSNSTHTLIIASIISGIGTSSSDLTATSNKNISGSYSITFTCRSFFTSQLNINFGKVYYDPFENQYNSIYYEPSEPSYADFIISIENYYVERRKVSNEFQMINIPYYLLSSITGLMDIQINFPEENEIISLTNYFNDPYSDDFRIEYHPQNIETSLTLMGKELFPAFTFSCKSQQSIRPLFLGVNTNTTTRFPIVYKPIYESNGFTTYIASFLSNDKSLNYNFEMYSQRDSSKVKVFSTPVVLEDLPTSLLLLNDVDIVFQPTSEYFLLDIKNNDFNKVYHLNKINIGTEQLSLNAPYGLGESSLNGGGGNNSNLRFRILLPFHKSATSADFMFFGQSFIINLPQNNDINANNKPQVTNYSFSFISNSKYLFKVSIMSDLCGVTSISFDGQNYKRISQFRINGDQYLASYEILMDFGTITNFAGIFIKDLCNNIEILNNGDYLSNLSTQFIIPFINKDINLSKIKDISFLFNNLDVSKESITNIIYFNYPDYDIKNETFSLRLLNGIEYINNNKYYANQFYGKWNSAIGKYQIEFIVPKNSRIGKLDYSISLIGSNSNYIPSSALSDDYQLYIRNSTFDGMGPIFSSIEKFISPGSTTFGWRLTISDISGFDVGFITVMGSLDNSIYKFKLDPKIMFGINTTEDVYNIYISLMSTQSCVNQDYIITDAILYDSAGQKSVFQMNKQRYNQDQDPLSNPFYLYSNDPSINKITITCGNAQDTTPPFIQSIAIPKNIINVGSNERNITFTIKVADGDSGININAQGPVVYLMAENFETIESISQYTTIEDNNGLDVYVFTCTIELPFGYGSAFGNIFYSVYGIVNNHGLYSGEASKTPIKVSFELNDNIVLLEPGLATSRGGEFYFSGKNLNNTSKVIINYTDSNSNQEILAFNNYGSSVISISNLKETKSNFYVSVVSNSGIVSNKLLVSPVIYSDNIDSPSITNAPQQCKGSPVCGGPSNGYCDSNLGCKCYPPWIGNDCLSKTIDITPPTTNQTQPSTTLEIVNNSSTNNNVHFKSLISIYSIREINIDDKILNEYPLYNQTWYIDNSISGENINYYLINITNKNNNQITQVSVKLEWFNSSKTISFANQDIEMNANSMKYTIEISNYQFKNKLTRLQLVMSALFSSTLNDSCSFKEFGETSSGDNSNYLKIQIDNKSLYSRLIKRAILDESRITSIENTLLDNTMNPIETSTESQSFIAINIPAFDYKVAIDPDFSVLLDSHSVDKSYSNSKCKNQSKSLTNSQLAGIIVGGFAALVVIIIISLFIISKSFKNKSEKLLKLNMKFRNIYK